jgi:hypothetical protein
MAMNSQSRRLSRSISRSVVEGAPVLGNLCETKSDCHLEERATNGAAQDDSRVASFVLLLTACYRLQRRSTSRSTRSTTDQTLSERIALR